MSSKSRKRPVAKPPALATFVLPEAERASIRSLADVLASMKAASTSEARSFIGMDGASTEPEAWDALVQKVVRLHQEHIMPLHAAYEATVKAAGVRSGLDMTRSWTFNLETFTFTEKAPTPGG